VKNSIKYLFLFLFIIPFYGQIQGYYNGLDLNKTGNDLYLELSGRLVQTHSGIPYTDSSTDVWDACRLADEDPNINTNVLLIYGFNDADGISDTDRTRNKDLQDTGGGDAGRWNREHVFPKSLANPSLVTDEPGPGTDVHNLRPADAERNTARSNKKFTNGSGNSGTVSSNGGWYPGDEWKGDVARIVMYMYTRYHGSGTQIAETNCLPIEVGFGNTLSIDSNMIDLFLNWNVEDPVSAFEANRNEELFGIQGNRNPFIDNPYLATVIWGGEKAEDRWWWNNSSDLIAPSIPLNLVASNVTDKDVDISWDASTDNIGVYDYLIYVNGDYLQTSTTTTTTISSLNAETSYEITIKARDTVSNFSDLSSALTITTLVEPNLVLPFDNFTLEAVSETCTDKDNGQLKINGNSPYNYVATINGVNYSFSKSSPALINDLVPNTYDVCITIPGEKFEQCYMFVIGEGTSAKGFATVKSNKATIEITEGTAPFDVFVNGLRVLNVLSPYFTIDVNKGDLIEVTTAKSCEGIFSKTIGAVFNEVVAYPNPTTGKFEITTLPVSKNEIKIGLYTLQSQLISIKTYTIVNGKVLINIEDKPSGIYLAKVYLDTPLIFKIVKE
jgi:endonuclease I